MNPSEVMQALYDSEITAKIEPDGCWNGGFRAQFGDDDNGFEGPIVRAQRWDELMIKLAKQAVVLYPDSEFAKRHPESASNAD